MGATIGQLNDYNRSPCASLWSWNQHPSEKLLIHGQAYEQSDLAHTQAAPSTSGVARAASDALGLRPNFNEEFDNVRGTMRRLLQALESELLQRPDEIAQDNEIFLNLLTAATYLRDSLSLSHGNEAAYETDWALVQMIRVMLEHPIFALSASRIPQDELKARKALLIRPCTFETTNMQVTRSLATGQAFTGSLVPTSHLPSPLEQPAVTDTITSTHTSFSGAQGNMHQQMIHNANVLSHPFQLPVHDTYRQVQQFPHLVPVEGYAASHSPFTQTRPCLEHPGTSGLEDVYYNTVSTTDDASQPRGYDTTNHQCEVGTQMYSGSQIYPPSLWHDAPDVQVTGADHEPVRAIMHESITSVPSPEGTRSPQNIRNRSQTEAQKELVRVARVHRPSRLLARKSRAKQIAQTQGGSPQQGITLKSPPYPDAGFVVDSPSCRANSDHQVDATSLSAEVKPHGTVSESRKRRRKPNGQSSEAGSSPTKDHIQFQTIAKPDSIEGRTREDLILFFRP